MDIYSRSNAWKLALAIAGIIIIAITMLYTQYLSRELAKEAAKQVRLWELALVQLTERDSEDDENCDFTLQLQILQNNTTIPIILTNDRDDIIDAINVTDTTEVYLINQIARLKEQGIEPIKGYGSNVWYMDSIILKQLRYFPFIQLFLISAFIFFGYLGLNSARRSEQNRVWVGMAKETAHQLGTPISAIMAWIENLKIMRPNDRELTEIYGELENDVSRLELIADRFSKIGSEPQMQSINIYDELEKCRAYMERRAPRKVAFNFPANGHMPLFVNINPPLFDWVIENLLRNALDAMEGKGRISAEISEEKGNVLIEISDTGKGIPSNKFKTVFRPGYTTKKRGWGLGLSLAKRIIEEYHSGKIFVKDSIENEGTTFAIKLPKQ